MTTQKRQRAGPKGHDVNAQERAMQALQLRKLGYHYEEIAQRCGYADRSVAWNAVQRLLSKRKVEAIDTLRQIEGEGLNDIQRAFMLRAMKGEKDAALVVLHIMERRARLLGLDIETELAAVQDLRRVYEGINVVEAASASNGHPVSPNGSSADALSLPRA